MQQTAHISQLYSEDLVRRKEMERFFYKKAVVAAGFVIFILLEMLDWVRSSEIASCMSRIIG